MERRAYFVLGDLLACAVAGAAAGWLVQLAVPGDWFAAIGMALGMVLGMLAGMGCGALFSPLFGALEVMLPAALSGMAAGMAVGMGFTALVLGCQVFRVLRPGSSFVFSTHHPFDACLEGGPPFGVVKGYWQTQQDWQWEFPERSTTAKFRSWYRSVSDWFSLLTDAGFTVERILEPPPVEAGESPWDRSYDKEKTKLIPATLIMKAKKP